MCGSDAATSAAPEPVGRLVAGFTDRPGGPGKVADFESSEPVGRLAGFASDDRCRSYSPTVPRSTPSSRAMRRCDQRCTCNASIDSISAILRTFATTGLLPRHAPLKACRTNVSFLKMAGFHPPITGWFCLPTDNSADDSKLANLPTGSNSRKIEARH